MRHTDELLLYQTDEVKEAVNKPDPQLVKSMRDRLSALSDLRRHVGYQMLIAALNDEARGNLMLMSRADKAPLMVKYGAHYAALTSAVGYVDNEIARLENTLTNISKNM